MKKLILMVFLLSLGCRSTKTSVFDKDHKRDSVSLSTHTVSIVPSHSQLVFYQQCDSLGRITPFTQVISTGAAEVQITSSGNEITASIVGHGSTSIDSTNVTISSSEIEYVSEKQIIIPVVPKWCWYVLAYASVLTLWAFRKPIITLIKLI